MIDPERWSEGDEATGLERELLLAGQAARMPEPERRALWAGIALSLPVLPTPTPSDAPAAAAASSGLGAMLTKGLIFLAAVGGLTFGAAQLWPRPRPVAKLPAAARPTLNVALHTVEPPPTLAATVEPLASPPATATPSGETKARVSPTSQLREESLAVLEARSALRSGEAARCLSLLESARQRFPRGALGQEREALTIQALARSGDQASARRRAEAFLRRHPQSPYVADIRRVVGQ